MLGMPGMRICTFIRFTRMYGKLYHNESCILSHRSPLVLQV